MRYWHRRTPKKRSRASMSRLFAAAAGYATAQMDFDRDGVDVQIRAGGSMRPSLDAQLKATINLGAAKGGAFQFPLKRRNYDLLREPAMVPRILLVLDLPTAASEWLSVSPSELIMRRSTLGATKAPRKSATQQQIAGPKKAIKSILNRITTSVQPCLAKAAATAW